MNQKSHLNIKKEKEKDENKSVNIIKEILNTTTQLNDFIKKAIQMNIKIIEVNECIEMINKISENLNNISNNLNKYIQDFQDEKEKYLI